MEVILGRGYPSFGEECASFKRGTQVSGRGTQVSEREWYSSGPKAVIRFSRSLQRGGVYDDASCSSFTCVACCGLSV